MEVVSHGDERPVMGDVSTRCGRVLHQRLPTCRMSSVNLSPPPCLNLGSAHGVHRRSGRLAVLPHGGSGYLLSRALLLSLGPHLDFCRTDILIARPDEWLGRCLQDTLGIACAESSQKCGRRVLDETLLGSVLSVYPVKDAMVMYKLQRKLSQIRLQRTYGRIQRLQSEIRNLSSFTPDGDAGLFWPVGVNPPFSPTSRFDLLTWDYFTEMHTFSCPDGAPKCPLQGVWLLDVQQVLEEALHQLNQRYLPWLHFRKRRLLNGYRRFDPSRGMEYTLDFF
ncbi:unnamed protein product [Ranitomeya imitator]|uniref:Hexosyltransferase n=1 Tax=Ranitomeya imitator TaxID=111125 RepID=A0ABN9M7A9_9NEOB|nr:unnamed protein product [Ranitomeya imitator]